VNTTHVNFAHSAVEFLVDMFNDEIDSVRINSINSLRKMGGCVQLNEEQLHVVLSILEDYSPVVRHSVHKLLRQMKLSNITCLHGTIQALLLNLSKYPVDQASILSTLSALGANHAGFTGKKIAPLFSLLIFF